jgi:hypothetical protein
MREVDFSCLLDPSIVLGSLKTMENQPYQMELQVGLPSVKLDKKKNGHISKKVKVPSNHLFLYDFSLASERSEVSGISDNCETLQILLNVENHAFEDQLSKDIFPSYMDKSRTFHKHDYAD